MPKKKIALVLSGGGAKGRYQARMLHHLKESFNLDADIITGVSVGALNGAMVAQNDIPRLEEIWDYVRNDDIYTTRNLTRIAWNYAMHKVGVSKPLMGAYANRPLYELLEEELTFPDSDKILHIGRVNLRTRKYESTITRENYEMEVLSSTAIPVVWAPVPVNGDLCVDGGVRDITPLGCALDHDPDLVIIIPNQPFPAHPQKIAPNMESILDVGMESLGIMMEEVFKNDIKQFLRINDLVRQADNEGITLEREDGRVYKSFDHIILPPMADLGNPLDFSGPSAEFRKLHADIIFGMHKEEILKKLQ